MNAPKRSAPPRNERVECHAPQAVPSPSTFRKMRAANPELGLQSNVGHELPSNQREVSTMRKMLLTLAAVATISIGAVAAPKEAEARWGGGWGWGGVGIGLAAGALIGGALAGSAYGYGYPSYYYGGYAPAYYGGYRPAYYGGYSPAYYGGYYGGSYAYGGCYRQRIWTPYGWRFRRVCY